MKFLSLLLVILPLQALPLSEGLNFRHLKLEMENLRNKIRLGGFNETYKTQASVRLQNAYSKLSTIENRRFLQEDREFERTAYHLIKKELEDVRTLIRQGKAKYKRPQPVISYTAPQQSIIIASEALPSRKPRSIATL